MRKVEPSGFNDLEAARSILGPHKRTTQWSNAVSMSSFHLIEPCCGSAALTMHLLWARRQVVPYHGSKWKIRRELAAVLAERDCTELDAVTLNDIGPWGVTWTALTDLELLEQTITWLEGYAKAEPRQLFDALTGAPVPDSLPRYAAQHLFLQRISVNGKAVGTRLGVTGVHTWFSPGFNRNSAYGCPATDRFGAVKPMVPSLLKVLRSMKDLSWPMGRTLSLQGSAREIPISPCAGRTVIYIDPPYASTTGYPNGALPRPIVAQISKDWHAAGAIVMVSEAEPIEELVAMGWTAKCLRGAPTDEKPFQIKGAEWVTISPETR